MTRPQSTRKKRANGVESFKDKDDLIAAVIERSFESPLAAVELPDAEKA